MSRAQKSVKKKSVRSFKKIFQDLEILRQASAALHGYRIPERLDGSYKLVNSKTGEVLVSGRTRTRGARRSKKHTGS